jgi:hypothetical protein
VVVLFIASLGYVLSSSSESELIVFCSKGHLPARDLHEAATAGLPRWSFFSEVGVVAWLEE